MNKIDFDALAIYVRMHKTLIEATTFSVEEDKAKREQIKIDDPKKPEIKRMTPGDPRRFQVSFGKPVGFYVTDLLTEEEAEAACAGLRAQYAEAFQAHLETVTRDRIVSALA